MKQHTYNTQMLGVVTLYNPNAEVAIENIRCYIDNLDRLIVWDNSPLEKKLHDLILVALGSDSEKVVWYGDGTNYYIAHAINYAWHYAVEHSFDLLLIMDQDSKWENFAHYRQEISRLDNCGNQCVYTPYINGFDEWTIRAPIQPRSIFINSGTVIPTVLLTAIKGADEDFPLDALDHALSYRIRRVGRQIICITSCTLHHTIGQPRTSKWLHLTTKDYGRERTYSITKSHILCFRKHHDIMTTAEKVKFFRQALLSKFVRMLIVETDKAGRMKQFLLGIRDGLTYPLNK